MWKNCEVFGTRFLADFATTVEPLTNFTRQSTERQRYKDENGAFDALKNQLAQESMMAFHDKEALTKVVAGARFSPAPHITNGFVYATLSLIRLARRLLTICKNLRNPQRASNSDTRQRSIKEEIFFDLLYDSCI